MKVYFTIFTILGFLSFKAQSVFNAELIKKIENGNPSEKINVLIMVKPETEINFSEVQNINLNYKVGNIYSADGTIQSIKEISKSKNIVRIEFTQHHWQLMDDTSDVRNRIKPIKLAIAPLIQAYNGAGVTIGVIDSGTDFNHPDFKDVNGKSRIKYLWDMTKPYIASTQNPFTYGQVWNNNEIDLGLCTHNDLVQYGHGTNSTGIAAGNGYSVNKYAGVATNCDIIVVAMDFNRPGFTIADAMQFIVTKAQLLGQPLVVNASLGDYYGSHDGTDLEAQMINNLIVASPGRALVASAGNAGNYPFHVGYNINATDTNFTWLTNNNTSLNIAEYSDTLQIKNVQYNIGVTNMNLVDLGNTGFKNYNYALNTIKRDTIFNNLNRIGIVESVASINSFGVYELSITIKADSLGYLWSISHAGTGRIDSWNFDYVTGTLPTLAEYPKIINYKMADVNQTIVSSFQCSEEVITVGNYVNRNKYIDVNNVTQTLSDIPMQLHPTSSFGPTRDNRIKPDITATGAQIITTTPLALLPIYIANFPNVVAQGGFHRTAGGTSASGPVVAGFSALYFQRNPTATNQQLKQAIINCAYSDVFTNTNLPNNKWGYGKLDGMASITCGEIFSNVKVLDHHDGIQLFPNPLSDQTTILFSNDNFKKIKLFNYSGQLVFEDQCDSKSYLLKRANLASGIYLLLSEEKNVTHKLKIIIL